MSTAPAARPRPPKPSTDTQAPTDQTLRAAYRDFVLGTNHPCVMAQTIFRDDAARITAYEALACPYSATRLLADLKAYVDDYDPDDPNFVTFMAAFPNEPHRDEATFERLLWTLLQNLNAADPAPWDERVASDPASAKFSFSLHGEAFYVVGLHPGSSRLARRAPYATVVFNLHDQFERLRGMGAYTRVRNRIRRRDKKLQGSTNPMLQDFGTRSEARQYSGRAVADDWVCPFAAVNDERTSATSSRSGGVLTQKHAPRRPSKGDRPQKLPTPGVPVDPPRRTTTDVVSEDALSADAASERHPAR